MTDLTYPQIAWLQTHRRAIEAGDTTDLVQSERFRLLFPDITLADAWAAYQKRIEPQSLIEQTGTTYIAPPGWFEDDSHESTIWLMSQLIGEDYEPERNG